MFNIGDVIIGRGRNVYRITNSDNLCIVTMTREDENMFNIDIDDGDIIVAPLISYKHKKFEVWAKHFNPIKTIDSKDGMNKGDKVVLREACEKVLGVPKDAVGEIVSFINEDDIIDRFGEIVVAFPSLKKYEIIRKNYIKHLTTL
ncbi:MAG: hypothetical protein UCP83_11765 [Intestinibacter bartlettii]|jgi:cellobiose-specific phosphotransferase system component IIB|nr:hypothetical protein [Intestinibacter bartlettii]